jgi:integrase
MSVSGEIQRARSAWLGHASAAFTMAVYTHSQEDALKSAAGSFTRVVTTRDTETGSID